MECPGQWQSIMTRCNRLYPVTAISEWLANNMSEELNLPDPGDEWSSEALNNILIHCLVSNRRGDNLHTFQCVEFESDLYRGVMRARCFLFDMENHRFYGKNVKVRRHSNCIQSIYHNIPYIWMVFTWYISFFLSEYTIFNNGIFHFYTCHIPYMLQVYTWYILILWI